MAIRLVIAEPSAKTGKVLAELLKDAGIRLVTNGEDALVSYGVRLGNVGKPTLNALAGMADKFEQLRTLQKSGVSVPPLFTEGSVPKTTAEGYFSPPLLARKRHHRAGKDLMLVVQPEEIPWRRAAGAEFFVGYVPIADEFRMWVYRGSHLGTYQKVMARPAEYRKIGRNYHNGFSFQLVKSEQVPRGAVEEAIKSLRALGLDFGAVDILRGKDGRFYVLEVNTAPGVEGPGRQVIQGLATKIAKWSEAGFPSRKNME